MAWRPITPLRPVASCRTTLDQAHSIVAMPALLGLPRSLICLSFPMTPPVASKNPPRPYVNRASSVHDTCAAAVAVTCSTM
jgi:hypothetical protein